MMADMFVWILILGLFTWSDTQGIFKSLSWISQKEQKITGHEKSLRARSKLDCIVICRQFSHCVSVAYDVTVGTCYLHPSTVNTTAGDGMTVYINKDPECKDSDVLIANGSVTWHRTLTAFVGDVICRDHFIYSDNVSTVSCLATGLWEIGGTCNQRIWINAALGVYSIPRSVIDGWSVCLTAFPTSAIRSTINLETGGSINDFALQTDIRFKFSGVINNALLNQRINNTFLDTFDLVTYFPFVVGKTFQMRIAVKGNATFEIYLNGTFYATRIQVLPYSNIKNVGIYNNINVTFLDLWCSP